MADDDWEVTRPDKPAGEAAAPTSWAQYFSDLSREAGNAVTLGQLDRVRGGLKTIGTDKTYSQGVDESVAESEAARKRIGPFMSGTAAAVGGMGPVMGTARAGATLLRAGAPLWERIAAGATEGSLWGGAHSAGTTYTEKPEDYAKNAGMGSIIGGTIGGVAPLVGTVAGATYRGLANRGWFGGPPGALVNAAEADAAALRNIPSTMHGMLPDAGPSMQGVAQGATLGTGGAGKTALERELTNRNAQSGQRITADIDQTFGPAPTPSYVEAGVRDRMGTVGEQYNVLLNNARAIDNRPLANWIDGEATVVKGAAASKLREIRGMLDVEGALDPHPRSTHEARKAVRGMLETEEDPAVARVLGNVERRMTRELQDKVPGIRELDSQYAELGSQERAIQPSSQGARVFQTDRPNAVRPNEMLDVMNEAVQPKGVNIGPSAEPLRLREATRAELDRIVGTNKNDLAALERTLGQPQDWNAQKLAVMFGPERAQRLADVIARERMFADTYQNVVKGPQTGTRIAAKEQLDASEGKIPIGATITGSLGRGAQELVNVFRNDAQGATRDRIAQMMAERDPQRQREIIDRLLSTADTRGRHQNTIRDLITRGMIGGGSTAY
jgi:hypothetical protein